MDIDKPNRERVVIDALRTIGELAEPLERSAVLERVGQVAAESIASDLGFIGLLGDDGLMALGHVHGGRTDALESVRVRRGRGLGGKILASGVPVSVVDYAEADSITHEYDEAIVEREGMVGMMGVPLTVGETLVGVAYVSHRIPMSYSDTMIDNVLTAVESAKVALSIADRAERLTEAAVEVERQRTVSALDESVGGDLRKILSVAEAIANDPSNSADVVAQARSIVDRADNASSAFRAVAADLPGVAPAKLAVTNLTPRELEVVQHAAKGMSNPEIGEALFLARGTVKAYMESALRKLGARNRVEAVMIAARTGLLDGI